MARFVYGSGSVDSTAIDVAVFEPTVIAEPSLWLRADSADVTRDGSDLIATWAKHGANGLDFNQATGGNKPVWTDAAYNGQAIVRGHDGDDSLMTDSPGVSMGTACTLFAVFKRNLTLGSSYGSPSTTMVALASFPISQAV